MNIFDSIILGLVQGLTEFIPVSSSGHLIIARDILGIDREGSLAFDAVLQLATGFAVLLYFWKDWIRLAKAACNIVLRRMVDKNDTRLIVTLILATIPAIIAGLLLEEYMDTIFRSTTLVALTLILGSVLMFVAEKLAKQNSDITIKKGFIVGLFQILPLIPGISRSGATISGGLLVGFTREAAARFSFLLATPIILGAGLKKLLDIIEEGSLVSSEATALVVGSLVSFIVGLIAIHWLLRYLRTQSLMPFVWYRILIALLILVLI